MLIRIPGATAHLPDNTSEALRRDAADKRLFAPFHDIRAFEIVARNRVLRFHNRHNIYLEKRRVILESVYTGQIVTTFSRTPPPPTIGNPPVRAGFHFVVSPRDRGVVICSVLVFVPALAYPALIGEYHVLC